MYTKTQFCQRFRMQKDIFIRIVETLSNHNDYITLRLDRTQRRGLSPFQKCITTICILAYDSLADCVMDIFKLVKELK